jgi:hypothetical protein
MPEDKQQSSMLTMFGVIFTVIALVALIALVLVRSKAQLYNESANVNQTTETQAVAPTIDADTLRVGQAPVDANGDPTDVGYYDGGRNTIAGLQLSNGLFTGTPEKGINLSSGGFTSNVPELRVHITDNNSIRQAIINQAATITVTVSTGVNPLQTCGNLDGNYCVTFSYPGNGSDPNRAGAPIVVPDDLTATQTGARITVATPLPYVFLKGRVNYSIKITPVDANGTAQDGQNSTPDLSVSNVDKDGFISGYSAISYVYGLPAISVAGWNDGSFSGTSITYYADSGVTPLTPGQASIGYGVQVTNLGNIYGHVAVSAQSPTSSEAWVGTSSGGGKLYMNANITHFLGRADQATPALSVAADYESSNTPNVQVLGAAGDSKVVTKPDSSSWMVPLSVSAALSNVTPATTLATFVTPGTNVYDTMIKPSLGSVGTYSSTVINTVSDITDFNGLIYSDFNGRIH